MNTKITDKGQENSEAIEDIRQPEDQMKSPSAVDWESKWLKGDEYAYILKNIDMYCEKYNLQKLQKKTHPERIYTNPQNGTLYFVEGNSVGSEFGFPRVNIKKHYRWKKMNFTTDLPKKEPFVTYIVASAQKSEKMYPDSKNQGPSFRMHAVILKQNENSSSQKIFSKDGKEYILCHIRKIDENYSQKSKVPNGSNNKEQIESPETLQTSISEENMNFFKRLNNYQYNSANSHPPPPPPPPFQFNLNPDFMLKMNQFFTQQKMNNMFNLNIQNQFAKFCENQQQFQQQQQQQQQQQKQRKNQTKYQQKLEQKQQMQKQSQEVEMREEQKQNEILAENIQFQSIGFKTKKEMEFYYQTLHKLQNTSIIESIFLRQNKMQDFENPEDQKKCFPILKNYKLDAQQILREQHNYMPFGDLVRQYLPQCTKTQIQEEVSSPSLQSTKENSPETNSQKSEIDYSKLFQLCINKKQKFSNSNNSPSKALINNNNNQLQNPDMQEEKEENQAQQQLQESQNNSSSNSNNTSNNNNKNKQLDKIEIENEVKKFYEQQEQQQQQQQFIYETPSKNNIHHEKHLVNSESQSPEDSLPTSDIP